jgi:outer membrane immunogenic protein
MPGPAWGTAKTTFNEGPFTQGIPGALGSTFPAFGFFDTSSPDGFIGGGQIGYNWQWSPLIVLGLEADFQGAAERDNAYLTHSFTATVPVIDFPSGTPTGGTFTATGNLLTNYATRIDWFGTVRGRLGYVWGNGNVLSYVTGGLAYGEVKINGTNIYTGAVNAFQEMSITQTFGQSHVNTGWVLGYGTEGVIDFWGAHNWTWKVETLYMDLGHLDATAVNSVTFAPTVTGSGGQFTTSTHFTDWILRGGINYKFY